MERLGEIIVLGTNVAGRAAALAFARRGLPVTLVGGPSPHEAAPSWYRAWWPGIDQRLAPMSARGVDLLEALWEESRGAFAMDRRGELWLAADPADLEQFRTQAGRGAAAGEGPLREHHSPEWYLPSPPTGLSGVPGGLDLLEDRAVLRAAVPGLPLGAPGGLHVRRAGGIDLLGFSRWLDGALAAEEVEVVIGEPVRVVRRGDVQLVSLAGGSRLVGAAVVLAADGALPAIDGAQPVMDLRAEWTRCRVRTRLGEPFPGAPALRIRDPGRDDWLELVPGVGAWHLGWTEPPGTRVDAADRVGALIAQVARLVPIEGARAEFSVAVSPMHRAVGRPALIGPVADGVFVSLAHGDSAAGALVAAEILAEHYLEERWPGYLRGVESVAVTDLRRDATRTPTD